MTRKHLDHHYDAAVDDDDDDDDDDGVGNNLVKTKRHTKYVNKYNYKHKQQVCLDVLVGTSDNYTYYL